MKVSVNWIRLMNRNYGCSDSSELADIDKLVEKIGQQLGAVEEVINIAERYTGIVVAKVVSAEKHPNADKLSLCLVDDGGIFKGTTLKGVKGRTLRNKRGLIQVVCGAPNVAAGQLVAWLPPGSTVPSTFDKDPFVLEARDIRGQISNGMIASAKELALGDDRNGILVLDGDYRPGDDFAKALQLDDYIIDIENKMFTHRPDCFGLLGVARELAGIFNKPFKSPDWYHEGTGLPTDGRKNVLKLTVKNELPKSVPRFCAVAVKDVNVGPSPAWLQSFLARSGVRPINNIVDITNWFMLATGQPLHAYDYDKLKTGVLGVRLSQKGEKLALLNGKEITLDAGAVVITDGHKPIGLGGIMGGADTEVDENTKNIVFECANFDMNQTRKTAMAYGLFTDAATRFTKNQSPRQNRAVLVKTVNDTLQLVGGRVASPLIEDNHFDGKATVVKTDSDFINQRLGTDLATPKIKKLLENVEFKVKISGASLELVVPFWRTDIEIPEDIVEEVGRLYGYDKLPIVLPGRDLAPAARNPLLDFKARLRSVLAGAGANEALTYSFVHQSLLQKAGQDPKKAYRLANALSPDLQYYRLSQTPSLLEKIHPNIKSGFDELALFEIGKGHKKNLLGPEKLPLELERLSYVYASKQARAGAAYYQAKNVLDYIFSELGIKDIVYSALKQDEKYETAPYYDVKRGANVMAGNKIIGRIGEFKPAVKSSFKLPKYCAGFDIHTDELLALSSPTDYLPLNRFPELEQDFCLRSSTDLSYRQLTDFIAKALAKIVSGPGYNYDLRPLDIFQKPDDKQHKQTTWRISLWHAERTLTTAGTNQLLDKLAAEAKRELKAERI